MIKHDMKRLAVCSVMLAAVGLATLGAPAAHASDDFVVSKDGVRLGVDSRPVAFDMTSPDHGSPGMLGKTGYAGKDLTLEKQVFRVVDTPPSSIIVETVRHSPDYRYVVHDLVGLLRDVATDTWGKLEGSLASPSSVVDVIDWTTKEGERPVVIWLAKSDPQATSGVVAWHTVDTTSNGLTTVCVRYHKLKGIPREVVNQALKTYPSAADPAVLQRDWVDDDLVKWVEILRSQPEDPVVRDVAARSLLRYELPLKEDWGSLKVASVQPGNDEFRTTLTQVADKAEQWRQRRKEKP